MLKVQIGSTLFELTAFECKIIAVYRKLSKTWHDSGTNALKR